MVQYSSEADYFRKWDMSAMKDVGEFGMQITTHKNFGPDTILKFRFKLPSYPYEKLTLKGRVIGCENILTKAGVAIDAYYARIEFVEVQEEDKEKLRQYITWFSSKTGGGK